MINMSKLTCKRAIKPFMSAVGLSDFSVSTCSSAARIDCPSDLLERLNRCVCRIIRVDYGSGDRKKGKPCGMEKNFWDKNTILAFQ